LARDLGIDRERPLVVAGSTGPGEEAQLIEGRPDGVQLLLAPRRPERWDEVARLVPGMPRRSLGPAPGDEGRGDVFLLDTIGELTDAYRLADAVFVGRSLIPQGGSNPLEAIGLGKATVTGPHYENFRDVVETLLECGGLVVSSDPMSVIRDWLANPEARSRVASAGLDAVLRNQGTSVRTAERILACLAQSGLGPA
ncbi:MAG: 3-deoxy-D-manno-octulosonic acid transferase, partial [Gemmatimonadota bacterium]|nr:3-deoxy-D-manno-octulosonic acid transferase [Gemmatimonadota bacterium]